MPLMLEAAFDLYAVVPEFGGLEIGMHQRLLDAIEAGDTELARERMLRHIAEVDAYYRQAGSA
jgi:DNA-binding FadR family transcriptional regulator